MHKRIGKKDIFFILSIFLLAIISFIILLFFRTKGNEVIIEVNGLQYGKYNINENRRIEIRNEDGIVTNVLVIENGVCDVIEANCPDLLCVHQKSIKHANESIICLPNKVVIYIPSSGQKTYDGIAQ